MKIKISDLTLLKDLTAEEGNKIFNYAKLLTKDEGEPIIVMSDEVAGIYTVLDGEVKVFIDDKYVATLFKGDCFGEMSYLEGVKSSATLRASANQTKLAIFTSESFEKITQTESNISTKLHKGIARSLSQKLRTTNFKISEVFQKIDNNSSIDHTHQNLLNNLDKLKCSIKEATAKLLQLTSESEVVASESLKLLEINDDLKMASAKLESIDKDTQDIKIAIENLNDLRGLIIDN